MLLKRSLTVARLGIPPIFWLVGLTILPLSSVVLAQSPTPTSSPNQDLCPELPKSNSLDPTTKPVAKPISPELAAAEKILLQQQAIYERYCLLYREGAAAQVDVLRAKTQYEAALAQRNRLAKQPAKGSAVKPLDFLQAELDAAEARLAYQRKTYERQRLLYQQGAISKASFEMAKLAYEAALVERNQVAQKVADAKKLPMPRKMP
jgi:hypothetical protein